MTVENVNVVDEYVNVYQGKKWGAKKIFGILAAVFGTFVVRDIIMALIYGTIYDRTYAEGGKMDSAIDFVIYALMILAFAIPLILPIVLRATQGAYFDEVESPLIPSYTSKAKNIVIYVLVGVCAVLPLMLSLIGIFNTVYMFIGVNLALVLVTNVVIFYYFGTYMLQRAKQTTAQKYKTTTLMMIVTNLAAIVTSVLVIFLVDLVLGIFGKEFPIVGYVSDFLTNKDTNLPVVIIVAVAMFLIVAFATVISGMFFNMTQNILYACVPTFLVAFPNIVIYQRIEDVFTNIDKWETSLETYSSRPKTDGVIQKIAELNEDILGEWVSFALCLAVVLFMVTLLIVMFIRAIIGLKENLKESA